ncbi:MAG: DNA (cytosine-5-)-methyltransferase [Desulfitobacteriaceae bacterium]|nr:DNA (cytosine-5-)-methyltransferase [Desulfitobacteriaceae bacterium]MDD4753717.1 DNA (cytosine-5-)-methyltransferase [Desulfitobacteriaceae bacterium]
MYLNKFKVREAMAKKGISTQTVLASMMGITKNQLSVMLSDRFYPIKSNVKKLCEILELSPFDIICEEKPIGGQLCFNLVDNFPIVKYEPKKVTDIGAIELFAGAGGLALGLEQAGLHHLALVELDKNCCNTLRKNRPNWNVIEKDIAEVNFSMYKGKVDVVTGGFPCQAFSYAGKKLGVEDTRGTLFYEFARCLKETKPLVFLAENVRGLISHDRGRTLDTILNVFSALGYDVKYKLVNAVNYGVPQKRERVIIVGTLPGVEFEYPEPEKEIKALKDALLNVPHSEGQQYSPNKKEVLDLVPPGGCWRDLPPEVAKSYMGKSYYTGGGRTGMARRISWDEPCLTLTCSPSQKQTDRCHPDETRPFTVREYARIQTFTDDWQFEGGIGDKYKQIGNAVPVELAYRLGVQIVKAVQKAKISQEIEKTKEEVAVAL